MEIDAMERYTLRAGEFRYQIIVRKSDEKTAEYYLDFKRSLKKCVHGLRMFIPTQTF